ncbi:uncharacterized protein LOC114331845 isoform X2 [Diabrotica virgifera virgifera]|uniref:Uncharacterized protein LOC114331845 n=1 Tax=Diabrotica virgifera virgifera TaxID=50390 RepID=A0A6P7FRB3_DIAVI|nr:uncharacterized protein LOC114331845 isoform X2 [Diabrotica virgifera virgifera]
MKFKMKKHKQIEKMESGEYVQSLLDSPIAFDEDLKSDRCMELIDIFLSSTVICFFVVLYWNSAWILFALYERYFPVYQTYCLGIFVHLVFALCQNFFHELLLEKASKNVFTKCFKWVCHKIYFQVFFFGNVMHWGGGFIIFDKICRVNDKNFSVLFVILFSSIMFAILSATRAVKNVLASPMAVTVDEKSENFVFNAQYFKVIYLAVVAGEQHKHPTNSITSKAQTIYIDPVKRPGRPFEVKVLGLPPQEFTPTTSTITPTTKKSTTRIPQVNYYKQHQYPKNIQEVLEYITNRPNDIVHSNDNIVETFQVPVEKVQETSGDFRPTISNSQLYSFKPTDISEVNLLATGNVRFSPPVWKNFQKQPIPIHSFINLSNSENATRVPRQYKNPLPLYPPLGNDQNADVEMKLPRPYFPVAPNFPFPPNYPKPHQPENGDVVATVRKPLLVNINIVPMDATKRRYPGDIQGPYEDRKQDAMNLQLKVYPDMSFFNEFQKSVDSKKTHTRYQK